MVFITFTSFSLAAELFSSGNSRLVQPKIDIDMVKGRFLDNAAANFRRDLATNWK
jgi:hypothetical protein